MTDADGLTGPWTWALVAGLAVLLVACAVLLLAQRRGRRRDRDEVRDLRAAVAELAEQVTPTGPPSPRPDAQREAQPEFVITRVGADDGPEAEVVLTATLASTLNEPLVRAIALGHGVRRALAPETRNRIRFEVRREVKRARKTRRREMRDAWREMRARPTTSPEPGPTSGQEPGQEPGRDVA